MSTAKEWRERAKQAAEDQAVELELPSGMRIRARRPGPAEFLRWEKLPLGLATAALGSAPGSAGVSPADLEELRCFFAELLVWCCLEPRVSLDPQSEEEIRPRDIPQQDWTFIVEWALRAEEQKQLEPFRAQPAHAGPGQHREAVQPAPVGDGGDRGPGFSAGL